MLIERVYALEELHFITIYKAVWCFTPILI